MKDVVVFIFGLGCYYLIAWGPCLLLRTIRRTELLAWKQNCLVSAIMASVSSLALFELKQAFLAMPGVAVGAVLSMVVNNTQHGGDPYTFVIFSGVANFGFYYLLNLFIFKFIGTPFPLPRRQSLKS